MASFTELLNLEGLMFLCAVCGIVIKRRKILPDNAREVLTDLVMNLILPASIIHSFEVEFNMTVLRKFAVILIIAAAAQVISMICANLFWNRQPENLKAVLQYGTQVSNAGFLGLPVTEGVLGAEGLMYASVFLIPQRIVMWTAGIAYFTRSADWKGTCKKLVKNPCIVAVYIGFFLLLTQFQLPVMVENTLVKLAACTTPLTSILIGIMVADVDYRNLVSPMMFVLVFIRQLLLPGLVFLGCTLLHIDPLLTGVSVLLVGMPVGSTSPILAAKYGGDYVFAGKCVILSTVLSLFTIPLWCFIMS
ncbi:MAG: AEC family transporter, partial [Lachnospiraceae bacterium]|nr:AEC family transporter [Lachnospiraceae bacterium]